jgi:hypothetical protein
VRALAMRAATLASLVVGLCAGAVVLGSELSADGVPQEVEGRRLGNLAALSPLPNDGLGEVASAEEVAIASALQGVGTGAGSSSPTGAPTTAPPTSSSGSGSNGAAPTSAPTNRPGESCTSGNICNFVGMEPAPQSPTRTGGTTTVAAPQR